MGAKTDAIVNKVQPVLSNGFYFAVFTLAVVSIPWFIYFSNIIFPNTTRPVSVLRVSVYVGFVALFLHLVSGMWSRNQLLHTLVSEFDKNHDGTFSLREVRTMVQWMKNHSLEGQNPEGGAPNHDGSNQDDANASEQFATIFRSMDTDADGQFKFGEFDQFIDVIEDVPKFSSPKLQELGGDQITFEFYVTLAAGLTVVAMGLVSLVLSAQERRTMRKNLKSAQEQEETAHRRLLEATEERERIEQKMIENAAKLENIAEQEQALTPASRSDADHKLKRLQAERDRLQLESSKLDTRLAILKKEREDVYSRWNCYVTKRENLLKLFHLQASKGKKSEPALLQYGSNGVNRGCSFNIKLFGGYATDGRLVMYAHEEVILTGETNKNLWGAKTHGTIDCAVGASTCRDMVDHNKWVYKVYPKDAPPTIRELAGPQDAKSATVSPGVPSKLDMKALQKKSFGEDIMQELKILSFMHNSCRNQQDPRGSLLVRYAHIFESPTDVTVVMEYFNGGDLFQWAQKQSVCPGGEPFMAYVAHKIALAIQLLHENDIAHGDIKPDNVLLHYPDGQRPSKVTAQTRPLVKVVDFGKSRFGSTWKPGEKRGPAVSWRSMTQSKFNPLDDHNCMSMDEYKRADLWSIGATLYVPLVCNWPKQDRNPGVDEDDAKFKKLSEPCKDLLRGLLQHDEFKRLTISGVLKSEWLAKQLPSTALSTSK